MKVNLKILLGAIIIFIIILTYVFGRLMAEKNELLVKISALTTENNELRQKKPFCKDALFWEEIKPVKGYKFFSLCNFVSGQYGDYNSKNVFGVEKIETGIKYIIGSKNGIFDQNTFLDVVDDRYIFLANRYEGEGRYIMIDLKEGWPTNDPNIKTVFPKTIDQYIKNGTTYSQIITALKR